MSLQGLGKGSSDKKSSSCTCGSSRQQSWSVPAAIDHRVREQPQSVGKAPLLYLTPGLVLAINKLYATP